MSHLPRPRPAYHSSEVSHTIPLLPLYLFIQNISTERDAARLMDVLVKHRTAGSYERVDERLMESGEVAEDGEHMEYVWGVCEDIPEERYRGEAPQEVAEGAAKAIGNVVTPRENEGGAAGVEPAVQNLGSVLGLSDRDSRISVSSDPSNSVPQSSFDTSPQASDVQASATLAPPALAEAAAEKHDSASTPAHQDAASPSAATRYLTSVDSAAEAPTSAAARPPELAAEALDLDGSPALPEPALEDPISLAPAPSDGAVGDTDPLASPAQLAIGEEPRVTIYTPTQVEPTVESPRTSAPPAQQEPAAEKPASPVLLYRPTADPLSSTTTFLPPLAPELLVELATSDSSAAPQPTASSAPVPELASAASASESASTLPLPPKRYCQEVRLDLRTLSAHAIFALEAWRRERLGIESLVLESIGYGGVEVAGGTDASAENDSEGEEEDEDNTEDGEELFYSVEMEEGEVDGEPKVRKGKSRAVEQDEIEENEFEDDAVEEDVPLFFSPAQANAGSRGEVSPPSVAGTSKVGASDADALFFSAEIEEAMMNGEPGMWGSKAKAPAPPSSALGASTEKDPRPVRNNKGTQQLFTHSSGEGQSDIGGASCSRLGAPGESGEPPEKRRGPSRPRKSETVLKPHDLGSVDDNIAPSRKRRRSRKVVVPPSDTDIPAPIPFPRPRPAPTARTSTSNEPWPKSVIPNHECYPDTLAGPAFSPPPTLATAMATSFDAVAPPPPTTTTPAPFRTASARLRRYADDHDLESEEEMSVPLSKRRRRKSEPALRKEKRSVGRPRGSVPGRSLAVSTAGAPAERSGMTWVAEGKKRGRPAKVKEGREEPREAGVLAEVKANGKMNRKRTAKGKGKAKAKGQRRVMDCVELPLCRPPPRMVYKKYPRSGGGALFHLSASRPMLVLPGQTQRSVRTGVTTADELEDLDEAETGQEYTTSWLSDSESGGHGKNGGGSGSRGGLIRYGKKGRRRTELELEAKRRAEKRERERELELDRGRPGVMSDKWEPWRKRDGRMVMEAVELPARGIGKGVGSSSQERAATRGAAASWGLDGESDDT